MTKTELARLAAAVNVLRPDWPTVSLQTYLVGHLHRPYRDAAVALVWVASDPDSKTPRRMDEAGPWWAASRTSDVPQSSNDCQRHAGGSERVGIRLDLQTGRTECAGCFADRMEATDGGQPLRREGAPIPAEARRVMVDALRRRDEPRETADV